MTAYSSSLTESLATIDRYSAFMPQWHVTLGGEFVATDDTLAYHYTAVRNLIDATGSTTLGNTTVMPLFTYLQPIIQDEQYIPDGNFERDILGGLPSSWFISAPGWTGGATARVVNTSSYWGQQSLQVISDGTHTNEGAASLSFSPDNASIVVYCWIRGANGGEVVRLQTTDRTGTSTTSTSFTLTTSWQQIAMTLTVSSARYAGIVFPNAAAQTVYIDGFGVIVGTTAPGIFQDGDFEGWGWGATPYNSISGPAIQVPDNAARFLNQYRSVSDSAVTNEVINGQQHLFVPLVENLLLVDSVGLQQRLKRLVLDSIPLGSVTVSKTMHSARRIVNQIGNDRLVSPMLLFPIPRLDVATRVHTSVRTLSRLQTTYDTLLATPRFVHSLVEGHATIDSFLRHVVFGRRVGNTFVTNDTVVRRLVFVRAYEVGPLAANYATAVCGSAVAGWAIAGGIATPPNALREKLTRRTTGFRSVTDSVGPAASAMAVVSVKPRSLIETLSTHDAITLEQLLSRIMGYIWVDAAGNAVSSLPDWGWVLVEDPIAGNAIFVYEVPIDAAVDLTREK